MLATIVAAIGVVDTAIEGDWERLVLFGVLLGILVAVQIRLVTSRRDVAVRTDLVRWLERRAAVTGETREVLADRAIAAYREGLTAPLEE